MLLAAFLPATAPAQTPDPGKIVRGLCEKKGCAEFAILDKQPVANGPDGELFKTRVETFHASYQGRASQGEENGFVYCSRQRPAVISTPPGRPAVAFMLAPDEQNPSYILRRSTNFFAIYFGVCHGVEAGRAAAQDRQGTARSFGYSVALDRSKTISLGRAEDILTPAP
jgi:hypothetical protein